MFESFTGLFVAFWKVHTYSTDLHTQGHKSSKKDFEEISPFSRKTYIVFKIGAKMVCRNFEVLPPLAKRQPIKILVLFNKSTHQHQNSDWKKILENFPVFQKNLHCVQTWDKNGLLGIFKCYPLAMWQ